jgi:choline dehydrogenase-like flavoprotein
MERWDYIIVGGGTAGALLANRLSAKARVLLLEAGGRDNYLWVHVPVGYLYCIDNPRTDWRFRTRAEPGLNGRSLLYPRGRILGGCSSINGMIYMRGQAGDYDQWRQMGLTGWGWEDVLPYFRQARGLRRRPRRSGLHGTGGEWRVENQRLRWDILDDWARAAEACGIPASEDFNTGDNEGVGYFKVTQRSGWRWNTAKAFLRPLRRRDSAGGAHPFAGAGAGLRGRALRGRALPARRRRRGGARRGRGDPLRRRHRLGADPATRRDRAGRGAAGIWASRRGATATRARTCRTICSCGWSTGCTGRRR